MGLFKAIREALGNQAKAKKVQELTHKGLDMEALREVAKLHEKYIEVQLKDGTLIKIWSNENRPEAGPDPRIW
jgi:hypothetical protein